jgi:pre-mRNA-processing factor 40
MLGNPGSNPLELFWDVVDKLDQELDAKITIVEEAILKYNAQVQSDEGHALNTMAFAVGPETSEAEYMTVVKKNPTDSIKAMGDGNLRVVYFTVSCVWFLGVVLISAKLQLHEQALKKHADEKRRIERKYRHLQDDLRYALKKLAEPLDINMSYEAVGDSSSGTINKRV